MSYRASQFMKRLDRVERFVRPEGSFAWMLARLSERDREVYNRWKEEYRHWTEKFSGDELYIHLLSTVAGAESDAPILPHRIERQLYPKSKYTEPRDIYEDLKARL